MRTKAEEMDFEVTKNILVNEINHLNNLILTKTGHYVLDDNTLAEIKRIPESLYLGYDVYNEFYNKGYDDWTSVLAPLLSNARDLYNKWLAMIDEKTYIANPIDYIIHKTKELISKLSIKEDVQEIGETLAIILIFGLGFWIILSSGK